MIGVVNAMRREHSALLAQVQQMTTGAISLHGIDLIDIYKALISNVQLGIGYAVPASYIPPHKEMPIKNPPPADTASKTATAATPRRRKR